MAIHEWTDEELSEMAKPRPHIYGTIFLNCGGCATPDVEIYVDPKRTENPYCMLIGHEVFIYLEKKQLQELLGRIRTKGAAALDEESAT